MTRRRLGPDRRPWGGIYGNESAYNSVHNALVAIILYGVAGVSPVIPGHEHRQIPEKEADAILDRGRRVLTDFMSQDHAPGGTRGRAHYWMTHHIEQLQRLVSDAEAVRAGSRPQKMTAADYEALQRSGQPREARERKRNLLEAHTRSSYGTIPPFEEFERDIRRPDPDKSDGSPYWPPGTLYPMELVSSEEIELAEAFGEFEEFSGRYGKRGFRGDERQIYDFLEYLAEQDDFLSGEEGSPGDLASSIMTTLGYEWI